MNTVIVPDEFTAANGYSVTKTGMAGRNHVQRFFFRVPAGNPVLKVDMTGPDEAGHGSGALPALPPVGPRRRQQRQHVVLHAGRRRLLDR